MHARFRTFFARWWSVTIAVGLGIIGLIEIVFADHRGVGIAAFYLSLTAFATVRWTGWRGTLATIGVLFVGGILWPESTFQIDSAGATLLACACVFGAMCDLRDRLSGIAFVWAGLIVVVLRVSDEVLRLDGDISKASVIISNLSLYTLGWGGSWVVAARVRASQQLRETASRLEAERDRAARDAVIGERARIARELHDVVAHSVSVMTVQAGGVRRLLGEGHAREREALQAIEETGRRALTEMRRMVNVMRDDGEEDPSLEPQPGLAMLPRLVDELGAAGLPVSLHIAAGSDPLPTGIELSVYRIVQEGLTNALKHAGPAHAEVRVSVADNAVEVVVEDDGRGVAERNGGGHGLVGMRERVAVYGGDLEAGPRPGGGFRLRARLPFEADA